jgi:hypothetical protein
MKKLALLLVLAMAIPAMADIAFTSAWDDVNEELVIGYSADPGDGPRGLALKVSLTNGAGVDYDATCLVNSEFNTFMDYAHDVGASYELEEGTPLAMVGSAGTLPATPAVHSEFVISMGVLKDPQGAALDGGPYELIRIPLNDNDAQNTVVSITADTLRGPASGVVGDAEIPSNMPDDLEINFDCYKGPDYAEWVEVGKPSSWCNDYQCHGDANNATETYGRGSVTRVGYDDIAILIASFKNDGNAGFDLAADFNHASETYGRGSVTRVGYDDVNVLLYHFKDANGLIPGDCNTAGATTP